MAGNRLASDRRHPHMSFAQSMLQGRSIAAVRALFGVTPESLAVASGRSPYSLSRLERSHRSPSPGELTTLLLAIGQLVERKASGA
jgi:hypothetical protein